MPPEAKFTREDILQAALAITREMGITAVTARALGTKLGCSSRPIFTAFKNMDEVLAETKKEVRKVYNAYVQKGLHEQLAFKGVGMQYVRFAKNEPKLFELLFMTAGGETIDIENILPEIDENSEIILQSIQTTYGLPRSEAYGLYRIMWVLTHGIACLCATGVSAITDDVASAMLTEVFTAQLIKIKSGVA